MLLLHYMTNLKITTSIIYLSFLTTIIYKHVHVCASKKIFLVPFIVETKIAITQIRYIMYDMHSAL